MNTIIHQVIFALMLEVAHREGRLSKQVDDFIAVNDRDMLERIRAWLVFKVRR